jgi:methenyltetrahydromethanopterin cyclohydrolase
MAFGKKFSYTVTTAADGTASFATPEMNGKVNRITYTKVDYADGVDFAILTDESLSLWTENNVNASKSVASDIGSGNHHYQIVLADQKVTIGIAEGGNAKSGIFTFYLY